MRLMTLRLGLVGVVLVGLFGGWVHAAQEGAVLLPAEWRIKLDPENVGVDQKWFAPGLDDADWASVSTHRWKGWVDQGLPKHEGFAWYRVAHEVPAAMEKKHVYLYFCGVRDEAWVRVNGKAVGEHLMKPGGLGEGLPSAQSLMIRCIFSGLLADGNKYHPWQGGLPCRRSIS